MKNNYFSKTKLFLKIFFGILPVTLLSSCVFSPIGYNKLTQNVPLLKDKNEAHAGFMLGVNHLEEQASYAATEHIGVLANFHQGIGRENMHTYEFGAGYYNLFKDSSEIEVYCIPTFSRNNAKFTEHNDFYGEYFSHDFMANYNGLSVQFDFGHHFKKLELGMALRFGIMNYSEFHYHRVVYSDYPSQYSLPVLDTTFHLSQPLQSFLTFAPTFKVVGKHLTYIFQISVHLDLSQPGGIAGDTATSAVISDQFHGTPPFLSPFVISNELVFNFDFGKKK